MSDKCKSYHIDLEYIYQSKLL